MLPVDFEIWLNHFEHQARHPRCVSGLQDLLRPDERRLIAGSIATFQLGEQSEGRALLRAAQRFAEAGQIPALPRIFELFVREEQGHAALLRAFMEDNHIALKSSDWTDRVFRRVRRLAGLELYLHVLISAELIGIVFYRALEAATGCRRLRLLCRVLVSDELAHVGFESQLLLALRTSRAAPVAEPDARIQVSALKLRKIRGRNQTSDCSRKSVRTHQLSPLTRYQRNGLNIAVGPLAELGTAWM